MCSFVRDVGMSQLGPLLLSPLSTAHTKEFQRAVVDACAEVGLRRGVSTESPGDGADQQPVDLFATLGGRAAAACSPVMMCLLWIATVLAEEPDLGGDCPKSLRPAMAVLARWALPAVVVTDLTKDCEQELAR